GTGMSYPDSSSTPYQVLPAIFVALAHRRATGEGQLIEISQLEAAVCFNGVAVLDYTANVRVERRIGNRSPYSAPQGVYRCKGENRWCAIATRTQAEWEALVRAMDLPHWSRDGRFANVLLRMRHAETLDALISEWTRERSAEDVMALLQRHGVPAGVVQNFE